MSSAVEQSRTPGPIVRFGPFEADLREHVLRKSGVRIRLQAQPFEVLAALIERPGAVVTREELQHRLWPEDTFVDFEHGLNAAITRLRQALGDSAEHPRYIETLAKRGYRFNGTVEGLSNSHGAESNDPPEAQQPSTEAVPNHSSVTNARSTLRHTVNPGWKFILAAALCAVGFVAALVFLHRSNRVSERVFRQLTSDPGLTTDPAITPDGKLVAYASDRGGGPLHIWVQQVAGDGTPIPRTSGESDDHQPAFSPDGSKIAFRSEREGGGIYVVPTLAGEPLLIAKLGRDPKFSPDGRWIAYWVGTEMSSLRGVATGKVFVVPSAGGQPKDLTPGFEQAGLPVWSPDSTHLLVCGKERLTREYMSDWWVLSLDGGSPVRTGAFQQFVRQGIGLNKLDFYPYPTDWKGNQVLFAAKQGDSIDIWRAPIATETKVITGSAVQVTSGTGFAVSGSASDDGQVVFASLSHHVHLWSLPVDANQGQATGELNQLTNSGGSEYFPSTASIGDLLAFTSLRAGKHRLELKYLPTGTETPLPGSAREPQFPVISPDGKMIAYSVMQTQGAPTAGYLVPLDHSSPQKIHDECELVWSWLPNGRAFICGTWALAHGHLVDVASRSLTELMSDPDNSPVYKPSVSLDGRWLLFGSHGGVYLTPFRDLPIAKSEWNQLLVTDYLDEANDVQWSPDANLLYFTSVRDGSRCVWAQRLDPSKKKLLGEPWPVCHFHSARRSVVNVHPARMNIAVRKTELIMPLGERAGNVWMAQPPTVK